MLQWCDGKKNFTFDISKIKSPKTIHYGLKDFMSKDLKNQTEFNKHFMCDSCHIPNALIDVEY